MNYERHLHTIVGHHDMEWSRLKRLVAPSQSILTVDEARAHCRIVGSDDDAYLQTLIDSATAWIEGPNGIGVALCTQQWRASMDVLPRRFTISLRPVQSVDSITVAGATLDPSTYTVDLDGELARVRGSYVPAIYHNGEVKVTFTCGYGAPADVPADLKAAAKLIIGHLYENREGTIAGGTTMAITEVPLGVEAILSRYR